MQLASLVLTRLKPFEAFFSIGFLFYIYMMSFILHRFGYGVLNFSLSNVV